MGLGGHAAQGCHGSRHLPFPQHDGFLCRICNMQFFLIDLRKSYHQIRMHLADIPKTAIITPLGERDG